MGRDLTEIYLHLIWATWDRLPLITPVIERDIHRLIGSEIVKQKCTVIELNGVEDHVHVLVRFQVTASLPEIIQQAKGVSSREVNRHQTDFTFKWRGTYAAYSVSRWDVEKIANYIRRQKEHHVNGTTKPQLELPNDNPNDVSAQAEQGPQA